MSKNKWKSNIIRYAILFVIGLIWVVPMYIAIITPFKSIKEIFTEVLALPTEWALRSFEKVFNELDIWFYLKNSVVMTGGSLLLIIVVCSIAAYAISRTNSRPLKASYLIFSLGLMIPTQAGMIALFNVLKNLHLYNTMFGLILAFTASCIPVSVFLFYGFFKSIPYEIIESAYIDGCSEIGIFTKIIAPLSSSAFGTVIIYNCVNIWKDFTYPLIYSQGEKVKTLPMAVYGLQGQYVSDYPTIFAGVLLSTLPLLIVFLLLQKQFIAGLTAGAVKG